MEERLAQLESRIEELQRTVRALEHRQARLEDRVPLAAEERAAPVAGPSAAPDVSTEAAEGALDPVLGLSLVGRTFLGLAGAYLLRAVLREELFPALWAVAAGLAYAVAWLYLTDRAAGRGRNLSAAFAGVTAVLVGVPLVWETTDRFALLSAGTAAAALTGLAGLSLAVAWRRHLASLAWAASVGAGAAALLLGGTTHEPLPFTVFLLLLGLATLWLGRDRSWTGLPWVTAALADLAVLLLRGEDVIAKGEASTAGVATVELALFVLYAGSFAFLIWRHEHAVSAFAVLQTAAAAAVGYGGAVAVLETLPAATFLGVFSMAAALGLYALAWLGLARDRRRGMLYFSALGAVLLLAASASLLARPAFLWAVLALVLGLAAHRVGRLAPSLHATLYAGAAMAASGLLGQTAAVWTASSGESWTAPTLTGSVVMVVMAVCLVFPVRRDAAFSARFAGVPSLVFSALLVTAVGGLAVWAAAPALTNDPGGLATLRTAVLALATLGLALLGRFARLREASLLVYPALVAGGVKLLVQDFPAGRPETLFIALAFYGAALILAPRLRRAGEKVSPGVPNEEGAL